MKRNKFLDFVEKNQSFFFGFSLGTSIIQIILMRSIGEMILFLIVGLSMLALFANRLYQRRLKYFENKKMNKQICICGHSIDEHIEQVKGKAIAGECSKCDCHYYLI